MNDAVISPCEKYRYLLKRETGLLMPEISSAFFVMLNPSTADAGTDDATIRRCVGFAKSWGAAGLVVANLYAYRATDPKEMLAAEDPVGIDNNEWLCNLLDEFDDVVCAWGRNAEPFRVDRFMSMVMARSCRARCFGTNKDGSPVHPLYQPADQKLIDFKYDFS